MIRTVGTRSRLEGFSHRSRFIEPLAPGFAFDVAQPPAGATQVEFSSTAALTATGALEGSATLTFGSSASAGVNAPISASEELTFSGSGDLSQQQGQASATIFGASFASISFLTGTGELSGTAPLSFDAQGRDVTQQSGVGRQLTFGLNTYNQYSANFLQPDASPFVLAGTAPIAFSSSADITDAPEGRIVGSTSITWTAVGDPTGQGGSAGVADITLAASGTLTNAAGDQLVGSTSVTLTETAALDGRGYVEGSASITFTIAEADVGRGRLEGSTSVSFAASAPINQKLPISGTAALTFSTSADGTAFSNVLVGSASITFSTSAEPVLGGVAFVTFGSDAELRKRNVLRPHRRRSHGTANTPRRTTMLKKASR